ncbi:hypothetical protein LguiA_012959 [Lonicera macranthoides]
MASTSTSLKMCEPPRTNTGGGGLLNKRRQPPTTTARAIFAKTSRKFNDQSKIGEVSYNLRVIDDDIGRRITR